MSSDKELSITYKEHVRPLDTILVQCADEPEDSLRITRQGDMWFLRAVGNNSLVVIAVKDGTMSKIAQAISEELARKD